MLDEILLRLNDQHHVIPVIGVELEWTLLQKDGFAVTDAIRTEYLTMLNGHTAALPVYSLGMEDGKGQVEAALWHTKDLQQLSSDFDALKDAAKAVADSLDVAACFLAKPFADDYGNGLHMHVHLEDTKGEPLYWKREGVLSPHLNYSIGGLLATMQKNLPIFAGSVAAYARYDAGYNAPTTVSWGMNNRTTALRIPDGLGLVTGLDSVLAIPPTPFKRIEHRVASSEASYSDTLRAILEGIEQGLSDCIEAPQPLYGEVHSKEGVFRCPDLKLII